MPNTLTPTFLMPETDSLARAHSDLTGDPYLAWHHAIDSAKAAATDLYIDPDGFITLLSATKHPGQLTLIMAALAEYRQHLGPAHNPYNALDRFVHSSAYPMSDWLSAIEFFYDWLSQNKHPAKFHQILGYIEHSIEKTPDPKIYTSLTSLLEQALSTYGFDA